MFTKFLSQHKLSLAVLLNLIGVATAIAQPIDPEPYRKRFETARKDAEVVAAVRVLSVACSGDSGDVNRRMVSLQVSLLVLESQKGPVKKGEIIVVEHTVPLPTGPGPGMRDYLGAVRAFPFTPGVQGMVALRWNQDARRYAAAGGWVEEPNNSTIPREVGQVFAWNDMRKLKMGMLREEVIKILGPPQKADNTRPGGAVALTYDNLVLTFRADRLEAADFELKK